MLATNHALAGAIIAVSVKEPLFALPVAFASHFVMDMMPHYWIPVKNGNVAARNNLRSFKLLTRADTFATILCALILPVLLANTISPYLVIACIFLAVAPDLIWVRRYLIERRTGMMIAKSRFSRFHKKIQWGESPKAWPLDIIWLIASLIILVRLFY